MAAKKTKSLEERLADRKIVEFNRGLIQSLDPETIRELVEIFIANPTQSVGQRFIASIESNWRRPVIAEDNGVIALEPTVAEVIAIINGNTTASEGIITVGRRRDKRVYYVRWMDEMHKDDEVVVRDPFKIVGAAERHVEDEKVIFIAGEPYDAGIADSKGELLIDTDVFMLMVLGWGTGEMQQPATRAALNSMLLDAEGDDSPVTASQAATYLPQANRELTRLKGEYRGRRWTQLVESYLYLSDEDGQQGQNLLTVTEQPSTDFSKFLELGLTGRQHLARLASDLQVFQDVQSRQRVFTGEFTRFRGSIDSSTTPSTFVSILMSRIENGWQQLWPEFLDFLFDQPDASPELMALIRIGRLPGERNVVHGSQINMPGDFRGANINIGTTFGKDKN